MYNSSSDNWIPMSLQDWVASASEMYFGDDYLKGAINVALLLAKQLSQMIDSGDVSLPDISVENVMIFVQGAHILSIKAPKAVRFELDAPGVLPHKSRLLSTQQSECAALGKILLELFSKGRSQSDPSVAAKALLLNSGMPLSICRLVCDLLDCSASSHDTSPSTSAAGRCISMEDVIRDLSDMKTHPQGFLYEHSCPQKALDDTFFSQGTDDINCLYGTETSDGLVRANKDYLAEILSRNLYLPTRYTEDLAKIVYKKTRGYPSFVLLFLRSIIQAKLLTYSVESRRWVWLNSSVSNEQISEGVAKLMIKGLSQLPKPLVKTLQIISCLGCQEVDTVVINALNQGGEILPFDMKHELDLAEADGLVEKAGTRYSFSHILIKQAIYDSIQAKNRKLLHKIIGKALLKNAADDPEVHLIGTDQVNIYCRDEALGPDEYAECVSMNISAANYLIGESKFEQAQPYIDTGMNLCQKCPPSGIISEASSHCGSASHETKESPIHFEGCECNKVDRRPYCDSHSEDMALIDTMTSHMNQQCLPDLVSYEASKPTCSSPASEDKSELPPLTTMLSPDDLVFIQVLLQYLEKNDKAGLDLTKMVIKDCQRKHCTNDSQYESLAHAIKERVRNTVGETHWAKALACETQLFVNQQQKREAEAATAVAETGSAPQGKHSSAQKHQMAESSPQRWQLSIKKRKKRRVSGYGSSSGNSSDSSDDSLSGSAKSTKSGMPSSSSSESLSSSAKSRM